MSRLLFLAGLAGTIGGFCVIVYQGLMYLMNNTWVQYSLMTPVENGPQFLWEFIDQYPAFVNMLSSCPLYLSLIILGCVLMIAGSAIESRYHS